MRISCSDVRCAVLGTMEDNALLNAFVGEDGCPMSSLHATKLDQHAAAGKGRL